MISLELPVPPSTNALYRNTSKAERTRGLALGWRPLRGRIKTDRYRTWLRSAGNEILATPQERRRPVKGKFVLYVAAGRPDERTRDLDNLLKATCDLLAAHGLIENDCLAESITVAWAPAVKKRRIEVHVWPSPLRASTGARAV